jgi:hypothetical protein
MNHEGTKADAQKRVPTEVLMSDEMRRLGVAVITMGLGANEYKSDILTGVTTSENLWVQGRLPKAESGETLRLRLPECGRHPRQQVELASLMADAANRGVKIIAETYSPLMVLGIQTLIAQGKLSHKEVVFHWVSRDEEGAITIDSIVPDENGAYGDWLCDFGDVELDASSAYLDAVEEREFGEGWQKPHP